MRLVVSHPLRKRVISIRGIPGLRIETGGTLALKNAIYIQAEAGAAMASASVTLALRR